MTKRNPIASSLAKPQYRQQVIDSPLVRAMKMKRTTWDEATELTEAQWDAAIGWASAQMEG